MMKNKQVTKLSTIFEMASREKNGTVTIPIRMKNGKMLKEDKGLFELLSLAGDGEEGDLFTITEVTDTRISIEISHEGVCNMTKEFTKIIGKECDIY